MRGFLAVMALGLWSWLATESAYGQYPPGMTSPPMYGPEWGAPSYNFPANPPIPHPEYGPGPDRRITERLPNERGGLYEDTPTDEFLTALFKATYYRVEYLSWDFREPGQVLLGSPVAGVVDPSQDFEATVAGEPRTVRVPTTAPLQFNKNQGIRGTFGLNTSAGDLEASYMAFQDSEADFLELLPPAPILSPADQTLLANSTLTNGQLGTNLFFYDRSFRITQVGQFHGAEINWIWSTPYVEGFAARPLIGFRWFQFNETLNQRGVFDQQGGITPITSEIDSDVKNRVFAPQLGLRLEYLTRWLTLGVDPKVAFGINNYDALVTTNRLRSEGDPRVTSTTSGNHFSPIFDVSLYARFHVRENFTLSIGHQLLFAHGISRPAENIYYNDLGPGNPTASIGVDPSFQRMYWHGWNFGGEFRF